MELTVDSNKVEYGREKLIDFGRAGSLPNKSGDDAGTGSDGRLNGDSPYRQYAVYRDQFPCRRWLRTVAGEIGRPMAQVALAWVGSRLSASSVLIGESRPEQVRENTASLDIISSPEQKARLDATSAPLRTAPPE